MKCIQILFCIIFLNAAVSGYGEQGSGDHRSSTQLIACQLDKINEWIEASRQHLLHLNQLKASVERYQQLQIQYIQSPENNEILYQMIREAHILLEEIKKWQLTSLFDSAFISELTVVSKPVAKLGIPKP
jgi:hypothetical protein